MNNKISKLLWKYVEYYFEGMSDRGKKKQYRRMKKAWGDISADERDHFIKEIKETVGDK